MISRDRAARLRWISRRAAAAWRPNSDSSSSWVSAERGDGPGSSTSSTPIGSSSQITGVAISVVGTYLVDSATSRANRGSSATFSITSGCPESRTHPAMPLEAGNRDPTRKSSPLPATASKTSSLVSESSRKMELASDSKIARTTRTTECSRVRCSSSASGRRTRARRGETGRRSLGTSHVGGCQIEQVLDLESGEVGMLAEDQRAVAGDVRRGEAVAGGPPDAARQPADLDVGPVREELHGRGGVIEELAGVAGVVAADRDNGGKTPGKALDRQVVGRRDQHGLAEVGVVGERAQVVHELAAGGGQAEVDHVEALLDGPLQAGQQRLARA